MLQDIFQNEMELKVYDSLNFWPGLDFTPKYIAKQIHATPKSVYNALDSLIKNKLVTRRKVGNAFCYCRADNKVTRALEDVAFNIPC